MFTREPFGPCGSMHLVHSCRRQSKQYGQPSTSSSYSLLACEGQPHRGDESTFKMTYMGSIGMMRDSMVPLVPSGKRTKRCVRKMDSSSWNCTLPSIDQRMKPLIPERHSMRYVWNSVQCVSASSVLTEK
eukprot:627274-Pleurochrysis_carterae.AAC.1